MSETPSLYLDRFEEGMAVLIHDSREFAVPRELLPEDVREGDYLSLKLSIDPEKRAAAGQEISELQERLKFRDREEQ